ncbi:hypothetical protein DZS_50560 [Dickeya ananatis]
MYVVSFIIFGVFTSLYNYLAFYLAREPFNVSHANAGLISFSFIMSFFYCAASRAFVTKIRRTESVVRVIHDYDRRYVADVNR